MFRLGLGGYSYSLSWPSRTVEPIVIAVVKGYLVFCLIRSTAEGETTNWGISGPCASISSVGAISWLIDAPAWAIISSSGLSSMTHKSFLSFPWSARFLLWSCLSYSSIPCTLIKAPSWLHRLFRAQGNLFLHKHNTKRPVSVIAVFLCQERPVVSWAVDVLWHIGKSV